MCGVCVCVGVWCDVMCEFECVCVYVVCWCGCVCVVCTCGVCGCVVWCSVCVGDVV